MEQQSDFKSLDKSLRKQRVVETAVTVFHEKGYRAATLDDVAKELGLTKAALYHYVASKEELLSVIYIQALESFFARAYEIGETDLAPPEKMRVLIRHHVKHIIIENLAMFAVFFSEENQLPEKDFNKIRTEKRKYTEVVEEIIRSGIEQGYFRQCDPQLQAFAIIGMCNWIYKWYKAGPRSKGPDEIADHFLELLEHGYATEEREAGAGAPRGEATTEATPLKKRHLMDEIKAQAKAMEGLIKELEKVV